jgi:hypothetical protein
VAIVVAPNTNFVKGGILIGFATNLGCGSGGVLKGRNLNRSSRLPTTITKVVRTPQMVFINLIMTTHVNTITDQPLMSSIIIGRYRSTNAKNPKGGYRQPFVIIAWMILYYDTWPNVSMPRDIKKIMLKILILSW